MIIMDDLLFGLIMVVVGMLLGVLLAGNIDCVITQKHLTIAQGFCSDKEGVFSIIDDNLNFPKVICKNGEFSKIEP